MIYGKRKYNKITNDKIKTFVQGYPTIAFIKKNIDLLRLKRIGFSNEKISKMLGVPVKVIDDYLKYQKKLEATSGVF